MRYWRTIDKHCSSCHGRGEIMLSDWRDGECWCSSVQCHCVEHHHDDEMKAFLAKVTQSAPVFNAPQNTAERDPSVTPDWAGADTVMHDAMEQGRRI